MLFRSQQAQRYQRELKQAQNQALDIDNLVDKTQSTEALQAQLTLNETEREALKERRNQLLTDIDNSPTRRENIQRRLVDLRNQIDDLPQTSNTANPSIAQQTADLAIRAQAQAITAEQHALETEILSKSALAEVATAERAWTNYALELVDLKHEAIDKALESSRASATEQQLETASELQQKIQNNNPVLNQFAEKNSALAEQLQRTAANRELAQRDSSSIQKQLESIQQDSQLMHRRLEVAGRKEILGRVMITRLDSLSDTDAIARSIDERNELIAEMSLKQIDVEEGFRNLSQYQYYHRQLATKYDQLDVQQKKLIDSLVQQREQLLGENIRALDELLRLLLDNNDSATELIAVINNFHQFLLGNLLWVRNFSFLDASSLYDKVEALLSLDDWLRLPSQFFNGLSEYNSSVILLAVLLIIFLFRWQIKKLYERLMSQPNTLSGESLLNILLGFGLSLLLVLPWSLALFLAGNVLEDSPNKTVFSDAFAAATIFLAKLLFLLLFARITASRLGVGRRFLKWDTRRLDCVRTELSWAGPVICIACWIEVFAFNLDVASSGGPMGAIATAVIAGAIITFCIRLLKQDLIFSDNFSRVGLRAVAAIAAIVIAMQLLGLLFAAEVYLEALAKSILALLLIMTIGDVLKRWLLILRVGIAKRVRDHKREIGEDAVDHVDITSLTEAHKKLLALAQLIATAVVLWLIWSPSLPAFNLLDSVALWHTTNSADPSAAPQAITLFDMVLGIVIIIITALLTKHLPSLSEVFMREWFNMNAGSRYATNILMQYMVIGIGGALFLNTIGWEWNKVQWLVAAMGVGIGFGLQEIVANFISGIIILFERPVRVGDIISVGKAEGVVKKINPRATIIETFDNKEHLIPNKELITGEVVNWSLSESIVRVIIPVGVAYGSDVRKAMSLLLEVAHESHHVLDDPKPSATFEDFGDNALLLWLRCHVAEERPAAWTELRTVIYEKFNAAGIVIAYPQRDVHLNTTEPLQIQVFRTAAKPS